MTESRPRSIASVIVGALTLCAGLAAFLVPLRHAGPYGIPGRGLVGGLLCFAIAGVLLVFCYLIVPSVAAMLYSDTIGKRLAIGWTMGTIVSALGVYLSLRLDLPTGATIVCTFGMVLIVMAAVRPLVQRTAPADVHHVNYADRAHGH